MKRTSWTLALVAVLLTALALPAVAQDPPAAEAPPADAAPATPPPGAETPPAASPFQNDEETLSYIIGFSMAQNLQQQLQRDGIEVNADILTQAIRDAISGAEPRMNPESMQAFMMQFQRTMMARRQEQATKNLEAGKAFLDENAKKEGVKTLPSGLQYKVIKEGTGASPKATDTVQVNYEGRLIDGTVFDASSKHGDEPAQFPVNGVIPGWTEALQLMKEGAQWEVYIPAALAYGPRSMGEIPPNSTLIFNVELVKVLPGEDPGTTVDIPQPAPQAGRKNQ